MKITSKTVANCCLLLHVLYSLPQQIAAVGIFTPQPTSDHNSSPTPHPSMARGYEPPKAPVRPNDSLPTAYPSMPPDESSQYVLAVNANLIQDGSAQPTMVPTFEPTYHPSLPPWRFISFATMYVDYWDWDELVRCGLVTFMSLEWRIVISDGCFLQILANCPMKMSDSFKPYVQVIMLISSYESTTKELRRAAFVIYMDQSKILPKPHEFMRWNVWLWRFIKRAIRTYVQLTSGK